MPFAISDGLIVQERDKPRFLIVNYLSAALAKRYSLSLKIVNNCEVWVQTFHRCRKRQTKAQLVRGTILQNHR